MMIEVSGTGCARCDRLEAMARAVAEKLGVRYEITHVREVDAIVQRGVITTPALAIDGRVVAAGRIPGEAELASWMTSTCVDR